MELNIKQIRFCEEYSRCHNASKAAELAGYSKKNARIIGCQLKQKPEIDQYIKQLENEKLDELGNNRTSLLIESNKIAKLNMRDFIIVDHYERKIDDNGNQIEKPIYRVKTIDELTEEQSACVKKYFYDKEGNLQIEFWDKQKSISDMLRIIEPEKQENTNTLTPEALEILANLNVTIKHFNPDSQNNNNE
jgi:phage terminase small subunit